MAVLAGGTLLAAQVETELDARIDEVADAKAPKNEDTTPLKLNDFKLPKDLPIQIPPGTEISPDLSKLTLPEDMDLQIPDDLDLSDLDFALPEDFSLELPPGTEFSAPDLKLPEGATIRLPDGREFKIPPGSDLTLPPEVVDQLLRQGIPSGTLPNGGSFQLSDLPSGLHATLDPPAFEGGGTLRLPGGTTIQLPEGSRLPFPPGILPYAARYLLPAGTSFDFPFDASGPGGEFPVPEPRSPSQLVDEAEDEPDTRIRVDTEITGMPSRVRKGEPFVVTGYVRELSNGRAIVGAPVDVFMNETKSTPGVLVGEGKTDGMGLFSIRLTLPTDKPASNYQLVNHALAFTDASGRAIADGWGDPPFATYATTNITLELPAKDGLGAITSFGGALIDHTGAPVPSATIQVQVDGVTIARPMTNALGRYSIAYSFPTGTHRVDVRFAGSTNYEQSATVRGTILIEDFAIDVPGTLRGQPGDGVTLSGRVLGRGAAAPDRLVTIELPFLPFMGEVRSDSAGRFSYSFAVPASTAPGIYPIRYALPEHNVTKTQTLELNLTGRLSLALPSSWDIELPIPTVVSLQTPASAPLPGQQVEIMMTGPGGTSTSRWVTDANGAIVLDLKPLRSAPGVYTVTARLVSATNVDVAPVTDRIELGVFEVDWSAPTTIVRGQELTGFATVHFRGAPYSGETVVLDVFGPEQVVTDAQGRVSFGKEIPKGAPLGEVEFTLQALDHPVRKRFAEVVAIPKLTLQAPDTFVKGKAIPTRLTLVDDVGDPIRDQEVTIRLGDEVRSVRTDSRGRWEGEVDPADAEGNVTMSARFDKRDPYLAASTQTTMTSVAAQTLVPKSALLWLLPLVGLVAVGSAGTWYYVKKRAPRAAPALAPVIAAAPAPIPTDVAIRFGIPAGEPPVWGVGDPLEIAARNLGAPGSFELAWAGGSTRLQLAGGAEARTTLTFPEEGEVSIAARRLDAGEHAPASASVRIVDYRKETAREFDLFLEKARTLEPALTRQSTPREIAWLLEARMGEEARPRLEELALVMEITNYSHYAVAREHYLRFVRAARALFTEGG